MFAQYVTGALLLIALVGCPSVNDDPPPIRNGACVVQHYDGGIAARRRCAWNGATWTCVGKVCDRGEELPAETRMVAR